MDGIWISKIIFNRVAPSSQQSINFEQALKKLNECRTTDYTESVMRKKKFCRYLLNSNILCLKYTIIYF